jgi:acid stress chaperone HdeB
MSFALDFRLRKRIATRPGCPDAAKDRPPGSAFRNSQPSRGYPMRSVIRHVLAAGLLVLFASLPALAKQPKAKNIDFGAIACEEFIQEVATSDEDTIAIVFMWLDGYLSGVSGDTRLNWSNLEGFSTKLMNGCAKKPKAKVLDVAKAVGIN